MHIRFHIDPDTELPHIYNHGVGEYEAIEVMEHATVRLRGEDEALIALGQTFAGRYLKVVYRRKSHELIIITAYDLTGKALKAYRRRRRGGL